MAPDTRDTWPDLTRTDAGGVLVSERTADGTEARALADDTIAALERLPWPPGLLSFTVFAGTGGGAVLTYSQWADGAADPAFVAEVTGAEPIAYRLYRGSARDGDPPAPGCLVVVRVEFDGPDEERQRRWIDTVFGALASETALHPGGISGHFHTSADGTRVLNYAEWTGEDAHRDALERSGQGTVGASPEWRKVTEFPGVKASGVTRYHLVRGLSRREEPLDSPTDWVAEHIRAYVETDGREGHLYQGWPTLLLTTRGRRTGRARRTALVYGRDGDRYLLVGSNAGSEHHPAWYLNLTEHAEVGVQVGADRFTALARTATAEEKARLWPRMTSIFPLYDDYRARTERDIPLVIVEPVEAPGGSGGRTDPPGT
ncbi:hypothetical protein GCM10023085_12390 [Actinomadura viridis]|uniref:Deazaflavin-dependent oxidoreductase (Nitroreductase family) n=1 Tax=Actinomadura viridis TaxID=58110 RepID=A0A931DLW0_9ACTN|nr:nitroreductase/quinone reductase family protein [Actinomadura viridis]MBG6093614.1 deazaflavin-dependent oxidoreductase (nitroreductase family) [Actinomadura viridis]